MITEDKVIEIFCMADDFCKFFDAMMAKYTLKPLKKRKYHRSSIMSRAEVMMIIILFMIPVIVVSNTFILNGSASICAISFHKLSLTTVS